MSIVFENVTKKIRLGPVRVTYEGLNLNIPGDSRMALLGQRTAGLEALTDVICAADAADFGRVTRTHSISWPIPSTHFIARHLPIIANARFVARLYEADEKKYLARLAEAGELADWFEVKVEECPSEIRALFCFMAGICLPFDQYVLTGLGPRAARDTISEILDGLTTESGFLLVGGDIKTAQKLCNVAYVFDKGRATFFNDMDEAAEAFSDIEAADGEDEDFMGGDPELENLVNVDFF